MSDSETTEVMPPQVLPEFAGSVARTGSLKKGQSAVPREFLAHFATWHAGEDHHRQFRPTRMHGTQDLQTEIAPRVVVSLPPRGHSRLLGVVGVSDLSGQEAEVQQ